MAKALNLFAIVVGIACTYASLKTIWIGQDTQARVCWQNMPMAGVSDWNEYPTEIGILSLGLLALGYLFILELR